jgi:hypothetical protein
MPAPPPRWRLPPAYEWAGGAGGGGCTRAASQCCTPRCCPPTAPHTPRPLRPPHAPSPRSAFHQPETQEEVERLVAAAHEQGQRLRVVGSALSPNGIALSDEGMLSMALMDRVVAVDKERLQVRLGGPPSLAVGGVPAAAASVRAFVRACVRAATWHTHRGRACLCLPPLAVVASRAGLGRRACRGAAVASCQAVQAHAAEGCQLSNGDRQLLQAAARGSSFRTRSPPRAGHGAGRLPGAAGGGPPAAPRPDAAELRVHPRAAGRRLHAGVGARHRRHRAAGRRAGARARAWARRPQPVCSLARRRRLGVRCRGPVAAGHGGAGPRAPATGGGRGPGGLGGARTHVQGPACRRPLLARAAPGAAPTRPPTQPNPTQPNPTQPNPTQPNPTQPNPGCRALRGLRCLGPPPGPTAPRRPTAAAGGGPEDRHPGAWHAEPEQGGRPGAVPLRARQPGHPGRGDRAHAAVRAGAPAPGGDPDGHARGDKEEPREVGEGQGGAGRAGCPGRAPPALCWQRRG